MLKTNPSMVSTRNQPELAVYSKTILDNGVRVVSEKILHVRSVSMGVWANVGSRDESEAMNGISHFLEHMVFKGTKTRNVRDIAQSLESLGGYLNAFTTKEQTCFYARVLDEHLKEAVDVVSDLLQHATFKKEELEKEKLVVIEELKNAEDDPQDIIHDYFEKALFPEHSLGSPIIGTVANLRRFRREDLQAHISAYYYPTGLVVAAAGNVEHHVLVGLVEKYFKHLPSSSGTTRRTPGPIKNLKAIHKEYPRPINQAHISMGTVGYSIKHADRYPLLVLNALLGEGMSSRLYQTIREKHGLAYTVYSYVTMLSDTGVFGAYIGTDKAHIDNSIELVHEELARLKRKMVSKAELARTKSQIKGTMMLGLENMSNRMMRLGSGELYFQSFMSLDTILKKVDAVTPEAIHRVANNLFNKDGFSTVIIRPA